MTIDNNEFNTITLNTTNNDTITITNFFDSPSNTMYYTTPTGAMNTITLDTSPLINTHSITGSSTWAPLNDAYKYEFPIMKEFEDIMPDLTKVKEMCTMYPAMDKAFENFKAIYDLIKDDYEARKSNDS